jgi:hypothetical protein
MLKLLRHSQLSRLCAALMLLVFGFMGIATSLHHHRTDYQKVTSHASEDRYHLSADDCALCDFAATLTAPAGPTPEPPVFVLALTAVPTPAPRPVPFFPERFCDRSAARAPPAATAI